ncbi:MBOAT family O-acyltransferase [Pseudomonas sp. RIT-PI-AD]|uniref:MBOAT family O-acyltransferase n=1 Tax=Pseudomonas sp. RIT-PI-AD TaxID=3035294 RepID=UPI0021D88F59|nr:MBOAT family O-acyltransferase [Pseudomonas sp. RIT-PI-AD]
MAFHSPAFLLAFLPLLLVAFHVAARRLPALAAPLLLLASLAFYAWADPASLPLLLASMLANYAISGKVLVDAGRRRFWVGLGVLVNLLPLILYKYVVPASSHSSGAFLIAGMPLGLSFYSFQQITCLFDIQRPGALRLNPLRHALFVGLFAQLPAGPISRYRDLAPQIAALGRTPVAPQVLLAGLSLFLLGLGKKVIFADHIGHFVDLFHQALARGERPVLLESWLACWGFMLQLYFDFSGYSDMAVGIALCFGLWLPVNFNSPLKAASPSEFVDRWHMSLVAWVREYLYQPLFRWVRRWPLGDPPRRRLWAWAIATLCSMGLLGAWHGASLALLLGGLASGVLMVLSQLPGLLPASARLAPSGWRRRAWRLTARFLLLLTLSVLGLFSRADSLDSLARVLGSLLDLGSLSLSPAYAHLLPAGLGGWIAADGFFPHLPAYRGLDVLLLGLGTLLVFATRNTVQRFGYVAPQEGICAGALGWRPSLRWGVAIGGVVLLTLLLGERAGQGFIYARL